MINVNRRQFLGRFFQAIISANNSDSIYGIYHPWRQYNNVLYRVTINLRAASTNQSGEIIYNSVPSISLRNTVIAVYDSNNVMIYCSAYKYNGNINLTMTLGWIVVVMILLLTSIRTSENIEFDNNLRRKI